MKVFHVYVLFLVCVEQNDLTLTINHDTQISRHNRESQKNRGQRDVQNKKK